MFQKLLKKIARALDDNAIPYMVIGGQALLLYGEPRLTKDIDITLGVGIEELKKVSAQIEILGLKILPDDPEDFVKNTLVLPAIDESTGIRVDFIFSFSAYERQAIEHSRSFELGGTSVKFASLEDLVIHKIIAGRARDMEDVKSILIKNPVYDKNYVTNWLGEFDKSLHEHYLESFVNLIDDTA